MELTGQKLKQTTYETQKIMELITLESLEKEYNETIDFAVFLTGNDRQTIIQQYYDWKESLDYENLYD